MWCKSFWYYISFKTIPKYHPHSDAISAICYGDLHVGILGIQKKNKRKLMSQHQINDKVFFPELVGFYA
jgi:hypothetical protein